MADEQANNGGPIRDPQILGTVALMEGQRTYTPAQAQTLNTPFTRPLGSTIPMENTDVIRQLFTQETDEVELPENDFAVRELRQGGRLESVLEALNQLKRKVDEISRNKPGPKETILLSLLVHDQMLTDKMVSGENPLRKRVWQEPDIEGQFPDPDKIEMPLFKEQRKLWIEEFKEFSPFSAEDGYQEWITWLVKFEQLLKVNNIRQYFDLGTADEGGNSYFGNYWSQCLYRKLTGKALEECRNLLLIYELIETNHIHILQYVIQD